MTRKVHKRTFKKEEVQLSDAELGDLTLKHHLQADSCSGSPAAPVCTYVLLVMLALGGHRLLRGAAAVLGAATQAVRHAVHLLQGLEPEAEDEGCVSEAKCSKCGSFLLLGQTAPFLCCLISTIWLTSMFTA